MIRKLFQYRSPPACWPSVPTPRRRSSSAVRTSPSSYCSPP
ncbi:MAG: hypothetical protein U5L11_04850 [Arhodomonas sp.]|nr:hypothetical protein [Arhodomonas sp.]